MTELATVDTAQSGAPEMDENTRGLLQAVGRNPERAAALGEDTRIKLRLLQNRFGEYLLPGSSRWILGRVLTALSHYFVAGNPEALSKAIAADWVNVLSKRPAWAVNKAFDQWIEDEPSKRPSPGAISKLAHTFAATAYERQALLKACLSTTRNHTPQPPADGQQRDARGRTEAEIAYGVEMFGISKWLLGGFGTGKTPSADELTKTDADVDRRVSAAKDRLAQAGGPRY